MGRHSATPTPGTTPRDHPVVVSRPRTVHRRLPASVVPASIARAQASATTSVALRPAPRRHVVLPMIGFCATAAFIGASLVNPLAGAEAATTTPAAAAALSAPGQTVTVASGVVTTADRDSYGVTVPPPPPPPEPEPVVEETADASAASTGTGAAAAAKKPSTGSAPVAGTPDPGSAKAVAADLVAARGWGSDQYDCLVSLWNKESGWNVYAANRSSGAYGIPQALPGSKMASVGADWQTNPATQITWGLNYIQGRYGNPCGAWGHSQSVNWY